MNFARVTFCILLAVASSAGADLYTDDFSQYEQGGDGSPNWYSNSVGWEVNKGVYAANDDSRTFSISDKLPMGRDVEVEATVVVKEKITDNWKTAGIVIYMDSGNYWHFALVEQPDNMGQGHFIELSEMYKGQWLAQARLKKTSEENTNFDWQYNRPYRLVLSLKNDRITGSLHELDGTLISRQAYQLDKGSVNFGRAGLDNGGFFTIFDDFRASVEEIITMSDDRISLKERVYPGYTQTNYTKVTGEKTGFFHLEKQDDVWWVIDPDGHGFYIIGTDHANYNVHWCEKLGYAPYHRNMVNRYNDNEDAWAASTASRLLQWGFNSLGANNSPSTRYRGLAHMEFAGMGASFSGTDDIVPKVHWTGFPNVFSPKFRQYCDKAARERCAPNRDDPWLVGYFIDNELEWYGKSYTKWGLWEEAFKKPAEHTAKQALIGFLKEHYPSIEDFNQAWEKEYQSFDHLAGELSPPSLPADEDLSQSASEVRQGFVRLAADRYFHITTTAIRKYDPNHMILGTRFAGNSPDIWDIAGKYCDIVSVNTYRRVDLDTGIIEGYEADLDEWYSKAGKPLMITEWSFPALDSGLPCTNGAGQRFDTQEQRAKAFSIFQEFLFRTPYMVGSNFFMWVDEPAEGIASTFPENTNYGLVDVNDEPYQLLTRAATELNRKVYEHHLQTIPRTEVVPQSESSSANIPAGSIECIIHGNTFRMDNGLIILEKSESDGDMIDRVIMGGIDYGRFTPLVWQVIGENRWVKPDRIEGVESRMISGHRELDVTATFSGDNGGHFRVKYRFSIYPGTSWIKARLLELTNTGSKSWHLEGYFQYALSNAPDTSKLESFPAVPDYYIPVSAWHNVELGTYYGVMSVSGGFDVRFWKDEDGSQHADALHRIRQRMLPGESCNTPQPPIFIFAAQGNKIPYLAVLEQIRGFLYGTQAD